VSIRSKIGNILLSSTDKVAIAPANVFARLFPNTGGLVFTVSTIVASFIITAPILIMMERVGKKLKQ
jgi:hypothetical protein